MHQRICSVCKVAFSTARGRATCSDKCRKRRRRIYMRNCNRAAALKAAVTTKPQYSPVPDTVLKLYAGWRKRMGWSADKIITAEELRGEQARTQAVRVSQPDEEEIIPFVRESSKSAPARAVVTCACGRRNCSRGCQIILPRSENGYR